MQANPAILAARLRGATSRAAVDVAGERLNPEFKAEFERETPTRAYGIALPWEIGGKRDRRIAVGEAAVKTGDAELAQTVVDGSHAGPPRVLQPGRRRGSPDAR